MAAKKKVRPVQAIKGMQPKATGNRGGSVSKSATGNRGGTSNRPAPGNASRPPARKPKRGNRPRPSGAAGRAGRGRRGRY